MTARSSRQVGRSCLSTRRWFITASSAVLITVTEFGGRREVQAHGLRSSERPWSAATEATSPDPRVRAMAYAILAPNVYNLQPWLAELEGDDRLIVRCDLARRLSQSDERDRETVITFGNFLELLRMAAAHDGYMTAVTAFPEGEPGSRLDSRPIAVVRFSRGVVEADPLFAQVIDRRTCKRPFDMQRPVTDATLAQLRSAVAGGSVRLQTSNDPAVVGHVRDLAAEAYTLERRTPRINMETVRITRIGHDETEASPDGIGLTGPEVEEQLARGTLSRALLSAPASPAVAAEIERYRSLCATAGAYAWLSTGSESRTDELAAGRDWLRIHLKATELGVSFEPQSASLNAYPEMQKLFQAMHRTLDAGSGRRVQMLARLGYAAMMPPVGRWPVETRIVWGRT